MRGFEKLRVISKKIRDEAEKVAAIEPRPNDTHKQALQRMFTRTMGSSFLNQAALLIDTAITALADQDW